MDLQSPYCSGYSRYLSTSPQMLRCKKIKIKQLNLFKHKSVSQRICRPLRDTFGLGKPSFVTSIIIETDVRRQSE